MAFVAGSLPGVDGAKCVKMALVHDIAEAIVGDITPHDPVTPAEKHAREAAAVEKMQVMLGPAVWASAGARTPRSCWVYASAPDALRTPTPQALRCFHFGKSACAARPAARASSC